MLEEFQDWLFKMMISGASINSFTLLRFKFKPLTTRALKWKKLANNDWFSVDRGAASDVYQSELLLYGIETEINNFITELESNRGESGVFTLSDFNGIDDQVFGADIDYSGDLDATYLSWRKRTQKSFKVFTISLVIQLVETPYPYDGTPSLPELLPDIGYKGDSLYTIDKVDTYTNAFTFLDHISDSGIYEGNFMLNQANMKAFRRYLLSTIRGDAMTITNIPGVSFPFGTNRGGFPIAVKVLDFEDNLLNINFWRVKLKLAESF